MKYLDTMKKVFRLLLLSCIPFYFYYCGPIPNNEAFDLYEVLKDEPQYAYTFSGNLDTLDTVPRINFDSANHWEYFSYKYSYVGGLETSYSNGSYEWDLSQLTDTSFLFTAYGNNTDTFYLKTGHFYSGREKLGLSLLLYDYKYHTIIKMDDNTYTFRADDSTSGYKDSKRIINTKHGLLYEIWHNDEGTMDGSGGEIWLLRKEGEDCLVIKLLNEFFIKEEELEGLRK